MTQKPKMMTQKESKESPFSIDEKETILSDYRDEKNEVEEKQQKKKKKTKAEIEEEKNYDRQADAFAQSSTVAVHLGLSMLLERMPKPRPLDQSEIVAFDSAFTDLAKKYFSTFQKFGEEINFVIVLSFLIFTRLDIGQKNTNNIRKDGDGKDDVRKEPDKK